MKKLFELPRLALAYRNRYFNNELYADGLPKNADFDFSEFAKLYG